MSFNDEQLSYMRSLARMPPETKCYCAWFPIGECHSCPPHLSVADRIPLECPECHNYPPARDLSQPVTHNVKCSRRSREKYHEG